MKNELSTKVGARIKWAMEITGVEKEDVCKVLGRSITSVNRYLRAENDLTIEQLHDLSKLFGRPPEWFLAEEPAYETEPLTLVVEQKGHEAVRVATDDSAEIRIRFTR